MKKFLLRADTLFLSVVTAAGGFFWIRSLTDFSGMSYKVRTFPLFASVCLVALCAVEFLLSWLRQRREATEAATADPAPEQRKEGASILLGFLWMLSIPVGILLLGFYLALPLFTLCFLRSQKVGWIPSILVALGILGVTYFGFGMALRLHLFPGILFGGRL